MHFWLKFDPYFQLQNNVVDKKKLLIKTQQMQRSSRQRWSSSLITRVRNCSFLRCAFNEILHFSKNKIGKTHLQRRKMRINIIWISGWWVWFLQIFLQFHCCPWLCNKIGLIDDICYHYAQNVKCKMHPISKRFLQKMQQFLNQLNIR